MKSKPVTLDEILLWQALNEKSHEIKFNPYKTLLDAQEKEIYNHLFWIIRDRCVFLLKLITDFDLDFASLAFEFVGDEQVRISAPTLRSGGICGTFPNYFLTMEHDEIVPQLIKENYISN